MTGRSPSSCACAPRATRPPRGARRRRSSTGTRRCGPPSRTGGASPSSVSRPSVRSRSRWSNSTDWSAERLEAALTAAGRRPIDLGRDPGLRVTLFRRADGDRLLAVIHHIAVDGWSVRLLLDDFRTLYRAERGGAPADLPPAGAPYAAFVDWQADLLAGPEGRRLAAYWRGRLTDDLPALALPADRAQPEPATADRGQVRLTLPAELTGRVRALARAEGATVYTVLLTSLQVLLHRYTGQDDIAIGSPTAGRPQARFRRTVGYFVNPVVIRADLAGKPTFRHLLGRTRAAVSEALTHQHYPLSLLADLLRPAGARGGWSLVQVTFNHQKVAYLGPLADAFLPADERPPADGDREVELVSLKRETGAVELALDVLEAADRLHVAVDYRADRFDAATVERLLAHYQALLGAIVADPDRPIGDLELLAPGERRRVLREWNATAADYPAHACLHELIAAQATRSPDAVAVVDARRRLTYRELDARANQVAHHLRELGVGPGRVVGLCLERSAELVVGLLGILKAGAAYLPLDPAYPAERLAVLLAEAGAMAVVAEAATAAALPVRGPRRVLLDADRERIARAPAGDPGRAAAPDDLAYVIFTSGSTGRPKGVAVEHRALVNFLTAMRARPGLTARDTLLAVTTPAFDIAALELFLPLLVGARVAIAGPEAITDGRRLAALLASSGATVMQATPATWRLLLAAGWAGDRRLTALCGGETLPRALADDLLARCAALWNLYGPTETTVWSAALPVDARRRAGPDRRPDRQHAALHPRCAPTTGPDRGARRAVHRRRRAGARLPQPRGADGRAVRRGPVRRRPGGAPVPDGRPGPLAGGRDDRAARPAGRPAQGARLPRRAGRDRGGADGPPGGGRGGRRGARPGRGAAAGRLRGGAGRGGRGWRRGAPVRRGAPAQLHGPVGGRAAGAAAADAGRQGRPARAARAGRRAKRGRATVRAAARRAGTDAGGDLGGGAGPPSDRRHRRFLRAGGHVAASRPGAGAGRADRPRVAGRHALHGVDRRADGRDRAPGGTGEPVAVVGGRARVWVAPAPVRRPRRQRHGALLPRVHAAARPGPAGLRLAGARLGRRRAAPDPDRGDGGQLPGRGPPRPAVRAVLSPGRLRRRADRL